MRQDQEAVDLLEAKTIQVEVDGVLRYDTPLLCKKSMTHFQAWKEAVLPSLRSTEKRLAKDLVRATIYSSEIQKLVQTGAVTQLSPDILAQDNESWYIPRHMVSHNGKNRLVFNCSHQNQGLNLNESLLLGQGLPWVHLFWDYC